MYEDNEIKDRILQKASEMFLQFGYSKVTMEEIAEAVGMSKKTLYKFFSGKEGLIKETIEQSHCQVEGKIEEIWDAEDLDFVTKLKQMLDFIGTQNSKFNRHFLLDIKKNMPDLWNEIQEFKRKNMLKKITQLLNAGIENGVFRKDMDQKIVVLMHLYSIEGLLNSELIEENPYAGHKLFEETMKVLLEGILTDEGRHKYKSLHNEVKEIGE